MNTMKEDLQEKMEHSTSALKDTPRESSSSKTIRPLQSPSLMDDALSNMVHASEENRFRSNVEFVERPRQLVALTAMVGVVAYAAFQFTSAEACQVDEGYHFRLTVGCLGFCFLVHCFLQCRDTILVRPHPGCWRIVHGCGMLYMFLLVALLFQTRSEAKRIIRLLVPDISVYEAQATSIHTAQDCKVTLPRLKEEFTEVWFFCHIFGWWGKMCIFRDWTVCWILSIGFEILELSLGWVIPQFNECWWDSVFMDALIANMTGMVAGHYTLRFLESHQFNWGGYRQGGFERALWKLYPLSWSKWEWEALSSPRRFAQVGVLVMLCLASELNAFMLLNTLDVPKESSLNAARLMLIAAVGVAATTEYYEFISNPRCTRLGQNMWVFMGMFQLEVLMWAKFTPQNMIDALNAPDEISYTWFLSLSLFAIWGLLFFSLNKPEHDFEIFPPSSARSNGTTGQEAKKNQNGKSDGQSGSKSSAPQQNKSEHSYWNKVVKFIIIDLILVLAIIPLFYLVGQWHY